ncbi:MAG: hypothetical protein IJQ61_06220 [Bacteroidales bacterium]|nr:hypothetical protein [Bacteroidales bacterium]
MNINEIKSAIENNYKVVMAAVKVYEANEAYEAAEKAHEEVKYDWEHHSNNDEWLRLLDKKNKAEGLLKKAVNAFFKAVGKPAQKWDLGIEAKWAFNKYIRETCGWNTTEKPLTDISLYSLICR